MLYLDHAASSPLLPGVKKSMIEALDWSGNPASSHMLGRELKKKIESARTFFESQGPGKFIFTSSATESNNTIINSHLLNEKKIWLAKGDHPSLSKYIDHHNFIKEIPFLSDGRVNFDQWMRELNTDVGLIALSHVDGQTGVVTMTEEQIHIIKEKFPHIWFHLDASQSFGKGIFEYQKFKVDSITICSHKIGGPIGIGGLYYQSSFKPLLLGGGHEYGLRSSTPSVFLIEGFVTALKEVNIIWSSEKLKELKELKDDYLIFLKQELPLSLPFQDYSLPQICSFFIDILTSDIFLRFFEEKEIYLSSSAACSSKNKKENPALAQLGYDKKKQQQFLRMSFGTEFDRSALNELKLKTHQICEEIKPLL